METSTFDTVARQVGRGMTRREALRGLVAGAIALSGAGVLLQVEEASARRRRRKHGKRKQQRQDQKQEQEQCGIEGDGCGALDADTGQYTPPYCCDGYTCVYSSSNGSSTWTCQAS